MSQTNFRLFFLENVLDFLWRQWSCLGVAGGARQEDAWIIDLEALLIFSLRMSRFEPRLFDEILDWLVINGKFIDIQRLRALLRDKDDKTQRLISAVACLVSHEAKTYQRKWQPLSLFKKGDSNVKDEVLFITKEGQPYPKPKAGSIIFHDYGFLREELLLRKMSRQVSVNTPSNIRFLLRSLFGIGSRPECVLYLLTHEAGHPAEAAEAIGISVRGTQDALIELAESGLVLTRIKGKRKIEYWLSQKKWWEFLRSQPFNDMSLPVWVNWIAVFNALSGVWDVLEQIEATGTSDYMKSSKLHEAMEKYIGRELSNSGIDIAPLPSVKAGISIEEYTKRFEEFIKKVLGNK